MRAAMASAGCAAVAMLGLLAASAGAVTLGGLLLLAAGALGIRARRWLALAGRSRVGACSEDDSVLASEAASRITRNVVNISESRGASTDASEKTATSSTRSPRSRRATRSRESAPTRSPNLPGSRAARSEAFPEREEEH
jgi:hypothetical protein